MTEKQNYSGLPRVTFPCGRYRENFRDCRDFAPDPTFGPHYCRHHDGGFIGICSLPKVEMVVYKIGDDILTCKSEV